MLATRTGTLPDLFKQVLLANIFTIHRPNEYWESHAQPALSPVDPTDHHGFNHYLQAGAKNIPTSRTAHFRLLEPLRHINLIPATSWLAMRALTDCRRFLFCSHDAAGLKSIAAERKALNILETKLECIQDDGVAILRGATMLLSDHWIASALVLIDPPDIDAITDAEISPLALFCEIANRNIPALLTYTFPDLPARIAMHQKLHSALHKTHLTGHNIHRFEGALTQPSPTPSSIPWGFGILAANIRDEALTTADRDLSNLPTLFNNTTLDTGADGSWKYTATRC